jgi:hypothetical protein
MALSGNGMVQKQVPYPEQLFLCKEQNYLS